MPEKGHNFYDRENGDIVEFRRLSKLDDGSVSVKAKSKGIALRTAGTISLLRTFTDVFSEKQKNTEKEATPHDGPTEQVNIQDARISNEVAPSFEDAATSEHDFTEKIMLYQVTQR